MRLLKVNDGGGFSLITSSGSATPYAILSHTWGDDGEEVTFDDIRDGTGSNKAGYQKLRFCEKQAKADKLNYFWVDTCCIDKSSSAELAESINSMFRFYQEAENCYVYLSDVIANGGQFSDADLRKSRWFTRGWTLQELLAPRTVEFYSQNHVRLGDRVSLEQQIYEITGIAIQALRGHPLKNFGVQERLKWIEKRQTTKGEDRVYCLLGIFDTYLSPIYGEGEAHALERLLRRLKQIEPQLFVEISQIRDLIDLADISENIRKGEESKLMQWLLSTDFWGKQVDFFGRAQRGTGRWFFEDKRFKAWLAGPPQLLWCRGKAGAGKTIQSAIIIDHLISTLKSKDIGIAWVYVDYRERNLHTLENLFANLLAQVFNQTGKPSTSMMKSLGYNWEGASPTPADYKAWLQEEVQNFKQMIVVIDALDELRPKDLCEQLINELRSLRPRIHLLVTSRSNVDLPIVGDDIVEIDIKPRKNDVILYIKTRLKHSQLLWDHILENPSLKDLTIEMLTRAEDRMFLKAELILNVLEHLQSTEEVEKALKSLRPTYDGCYEFTLKQIERKDAFERDLAFKILTWLSHVFGALTTKALQEALCVQAGDQKVDEKMLIPVKTITAVCSGLVITYTANEVENISLLHETASAFLRSAGLPSGHDIILEASLAYLSLPEFSKLCIHRAQINERGRQHAFYAYAAMYWSNHAIKGNLEQAFQSRIVQFLESTQCRSADEFLASGQSSAWGCDKATPWTDWNKKSTDRRDSPLHAAATLGLAQTVRYLVQERGYQTEQRNNFGETSLHRTAQVGSTKTMDELIALGADVGAKVHHHYLKETTSIMLAAACQQIDAIRVLLNRGVTINDLDPKSPLSWTVPLHLAASMNTALTRLLLDYGASVRLPGISPQYAELWPSSLHLTVYNAHAFRAGARERLDLLLDRGTDIDAQSSAGNTALHMAILGGHEDLVRSLLRKGAKCTILNRNGKSAVQLARERGHFRWIEQGVAEDVSRELRIGPPLHQAIWLKDYTLAKELLDAGHDVAEEDQEKVTPWDYCILSSDVKLAQLLVDHMEHCESMHHAGSAAFETALNHMTAFNYTDHHSWELTVKICTKLLPFRKKFDPTLEFTKRLSPICNYQKTFFIWASELGRLSQAKFLLSCGSDINALDFDGNTGLHHAMGNFDMASFLIQNGANLELKNRSGHTPIFLAETGGNAMIKDLFKAVLTRNHFSDTSLTVSR